MPDTCPEETAPPMAEPGPSALAEAARATARRGAGAELLADLASRVEAEASLPPPPAPTFALALLDELRDEVVAGWLSSPQPPAPERASAVLRAFDRVRERLLSPGGEHSPLKVIAEFAHDLRSPLTSILFLAGALREGQSGGLGEPQRRQVGIIYSAALGLVWVVRDRTEPYRGPGGGAAELTPLSVSGMFDSLADVLAPLAEEKQVELRLSPCDQLPRLGNPVSLSRVLLNLAVNALQCTDEGWVEIAAEPEAGDGRLRFWVRDTGRGIDAEALDPATGHFRRHGGGYGFSGTGLGLGICRKLVAEMGGELSVESAPGAGTRAWFALELPEAPGH